MKLYTEEQVRKALLFSLAEDATMDKILDLLTPIELPSDEEIKERRKEDFKIGYNQGYLDAQLNHVNDADNLANEYDYLTNTDINER